MQGLCCRTVLTIHLVSCAAQLGMQKAELVLDTKSMIPCVVMACSTAWLVW